VWGDARNGDVGVEGGVARADSGENDGTGRGRYERRCARRRDAELEDENHTTKKRVCARRHETKSRLGRTPIGNTQ
jgi:hypothetical protein